MATNGARRPPDHEVVVIGAGPGGIAAAIMLLQAGVTDLAVLERADGVGGSWRDNTYPGIGVDIPSLAYQYSFARNPAWSRVFARGAEVLAYHEDVAERFGLGPHLEFNSEVVREVWDDDAHLWHLSLADGRTVTARFVVSAVGAFLRAKDDPGIEGLDTFTGKVQRPDAWDHEHDLRGARVAVIGTGASAVQIVPAIAKDVARLDVYQRTPVWCLPKLDAPVPRWFQRVLSVPGVAAALHGASLAGVELFLRGLTQTPDTIGRPALRAIDRVTLGRYRALIARKVRDPETRAALTPDYGMFAKRPTFSNHYLTAFNQDHVDLITDPIARITPTGIATRDGTARDVDVLVLATGYHLFSDPESYEPGTIIGRDGFDLGRWYRDEGLQAYESVAVPGLPNRWTVVGPYSWTGTGWHALVELNARHITRAITAARARRATAVEVRREAHDAYHADIRRHGRLIDWYFTGLNGHVRSYYVNSQGDVPYIRPASLLQARRRAARFPLGDYRFTAGRYESDREMIMRCTSLVPS